MIVLGFSGIGNAAEYRRRYGLRFVGHDAAVALVRDGEVLFAAEEERFSREKHTAEFPCRATRAALASAGIGFEELDLLAYTWHATPLRIASMFARHPWRIPVQHWPALASAGARVVRDLMTPGRAGRGFAQALGVSSRPCTGVSHHLGHAACAHLTSGFERSAVLTVDGQGEDESASLSEWNGVEVRRLGAIRSPDSIGILYGMVTDFLGMRAGWDEYKVMGMAAHGDPTRFRAALRELVVLDGPGSYRTRHTALVFRPGACDALLQRELGIPPRASDEALGAAHFDLAAALQERTQEVVFHLLHALRERSEVQDLCLAGGVFQNSVINGQILASGLFRRVHVPPVPGDQGGALGAALLASARAGHAPRRPSAGSAFLGPGYAEAELVAALGAHAGELEWERPADLVGAASELVGSGRIVGWFQGRMEYGPRALGHRSLLAAPAPRAMRERMNRCIKHREEFRPFAASVVAERAAEFFELSERSPYMQFVARVRPEHAALLEAVVHHGTSRVQTVAREDDPLFHALLCERGRRGGAPIVLNTSFNDVDQPIVCTPEDALRAFLGMEVDALVLGPFVVVKRAARA